MTFVETALGGLGGRGLPRVALRSELAEDASLLDSARGARELGYVAEHSWREVLDEAASTPRN